LRVVLGGDERRVRRSAECVREHRDLLVDLGAERLSGRCWRGRGRDGLKRDRATYPVRNGSTVAM
jgi:hypothetical protein